MSEAIVYKLKHPIEIRSKDTGAVIETVTEFHMQRPKGKMLKAIDKTSGEGSAVLAILAAIAGVPPSVMDEADLGDIAGMQEVAADFLAPFREMAGRS